MKKVYFILVIVFNILLNTVLTFAQTNIPQATTLLNATSPASGQLTIRFIENPDADGYEVMTSNSNKFPSNGVTRLFTINTTKYSKLTFRGVPEGQDFYVKIRAYCFAGSKKVYGPWSNVKEVKLSAAYRPTGTSITAISSAVNGVFLRWKKVEGVSGYIVRYSTEKSFNNTALIKKKRVTSKNETTINGLRSNVPYYFQVQTFETINGKEYYSAFGDHVWKKTPLSGSDSVSSEYRPAGTSFTSVESGSKSVKLKWKKVAGVSGYIIRYSTDKTFEDKDIIKKVWMYSHSDSEKKIEGLKSNVPYYFQIQTYVIINSKFYYSIFGDNVWKKTPN